MVRLKGRTQCKIKLSRYLFQFQYGSIKRALAQGGTMQASAFQFQYGSIKR